MATDRTLPTGKGSARFEDAGTPSRAEIQQRVSSLYDRAENDSGTFNATRAQKNGARRTVSSVANSPRRAAADPSLEAVARQWFDMARNRLGPVTPATLPADRMPERPSRPPRAEQPAGSDTVRELEAAARRELPSGGRREPESGERRTPELTGRAVAALPAVPSPRQEEPRALPAAPASAPAALPASAPAAPQSSLRTSKEQIRRKLDTAREILARGIAQPAAALPALEARPAEQTWDTGELPSYRTATTNTWAAGQQPGNTGQFVSGNNTGQFPTVGASNTGQFPTVDATGTGQFPTVGGNNTGQFPTVGSANTGQFPTMDPTGTGQFPAVGANSTGQFPTMGGNNTGQFPAVDPTGTGQYPVVGAADTGQFPAVDPTGTGQFPAVSANSTGQFPTVGADGTGQFPAARTATPAPAAGPGALDPSLGAPVGGFPAPETGLLAASYGDLLAPAPAGLPAQQPQAAPAAPGFVLPTPQVPLPAPSYAPAVPEVTLPTPAYAPAMPQAAQPTYAPPAPQAAPPAPAFAAPSPLPTAPADVTAHATGTAYLGKADKALSFARAQLGRPCVIGATGPESYDCSSLTQAAWKAAGVTLPRSAVDQARAFTPVGLDDLRAGDLVFFHDDLSHTGVCTGDGMMIHAPGPGARIREDSVHSLGEGALRGAVRPA
ncbi:C40 family peptidase [Streptomyces sp. NPDC002328]|uniref:C40 family peptidase n=1 Tax=Streptomyces sp. NPDC002328 TaxID=3364642 RepID=UPI0036A3994D